MKKIFTILILTSLFSGELEVDGDLKVSGNIDANGNVITNVGEPVLTTDVATANYVNSRTIGKGRIIMLKCGWVSYTSYDQVPSVESCDPPICPNGWNSLAVYSENTAAGGPASDTSTETPYLHIINLFFVWECHQ